tara:strand:+ start:787 stop:1041 length:255 start_codon:yes stop_codon:yes gene_type:complete
MKNIPYAIRVALYVRETEKKHIAGPLKMGDGVYQKAKANMKRNSRQNAVILFANLAWIPSIGGPTPSINDPKANIQFLTIYRIT